MGASFSSGGTKSKPKTTSQGFTQTSQGSSAPYGGLVGINWQAPQTVQPIAPAIPAPAPPPPYNPYASPIYTGAQANANKAYADIISNLHNSENLNASDLGYTLTRDPTDNVTGGQLDWNTIDTTNPFSRAALLKQSYNQGRVGSVNSMADQGQLYSGSLQNALNAGQFNYEQGQDSIAKQLQQLILNSQQTASGAAANKDNALYQAYLAALQNAPQPD